MRLGDLDALKAEVALMFGDKTHITESVCELIDKAPSVEYTFEEAFQKTVCDQKLYCPERPRGEWIISEYVDTRRGFITKCPFCKTDTIGGGNFCPNCGAKMQKGSAG